MQAGGHDSNGQGPGDESEDDDYGANEEEPYRLVDSDHTYTELFSFLCVEAFLRGHYPDKSRIASLLTNENTFFFSREKKSKLSYIHFCYFTINSISHPFFYF